MLNKIKQMRSQGLEVVIAPKPNFGLNKYFSELDILRVGCVNVNEPNFNNGVYIEDPKGNVKNSVYFLLERHLKHFEIVESSFKDLAKAVVAAWSDDLLGEIHICDKKIKYNSKNLDSGGNIPFDAEHKDFNVFEYHISKINSLYNQSFSIDSVDDMDKLVGPVKLKLMNGEECKYENGKIKHGCAVYEASYLLLKGATAYVTRKKNGGLNE